MPYYDAATVKDAACGRWVDILVQLGVDSDYLRNVHGPCPGCGGKDRFRFDDRDGDGTFICSQGGGDNLSGDGFTLLQHAKNWEWKRAIGEVAELLGIGSAEPPKHLPLAKRTAPLPSPKFENEKLSAFARRWRDLTDTAWLADRSALDPLRVSATKFLSSLYRPGEKVVVFTDAQSQGQALWPDETLPLAAAEGVWFLAQPVDGEYRENPRAYDVAKGAKMSRRSEESITAWRYLVLESDKADARDWIGALVQLPLAIAAIYTSGKRSVHALVRVDASSVEDWRNFSAAIKPILVTIGADQQVVSSAVRLSRLPGCLRGDRLQKLLFLNPDPSAKPLCVLPRVRDSLTYWTEAATRYLLRDCADIIERNLEKQLAENLSARFDAAENVYQGANLDECISALESAAAGYGESITDCIFALEWFSTCPRARMLLQKLRAARG